MKNVVAIDFETYLIDSENPWPKPVCLSYYDLQSKTSGVLVGEAMDGFLFDLLSSQKTVVAHNATFELLVIWTYYPQYRNFLLQKLTEHKFWCSMIGEQMVDNLRYHQIAKGGFGLDKLVKKYFNIDISEDKKNPDSWRLRYSELDGIPVEKWPQEAYDYALNDSIYAGRIYEKQKLLVTGVELETKHSFYLNLIASRGQYIDQDKVAVIKRELEDKLKKHYSVLQDLGLGEYDERQKKKKKNVKLLQKYVADSGFTPIKTAKGAIKLSSDALSHYLSEKPDDPVINALHDVAKAEKVYSAFIPALMKAQPLMRTGYNVFVSTGRTSSRANQAYASVNIQQMPRSTPGLSYDIRNCFSPRPSYKYVSIDYSGLELASCANQLKEILGWSKIADQLNSGNTPSDLHSALAARIYQMKKGQKISYDEFVKRKKEKEFAWFRQLAKPLNLGFPGGIGYETMRELLAADGIYPAYKLLLKYNSEQIAVAVVIKLREEGVPARVQQLSPTEYAVVYDELVELKQIMFSLYPCLEEFLTNGHARYANGKVKRKKNKFGQWEEEKLYNYEVGHVKRYNCNYTAACNGILMQTPSAIGAKNAVDSVAEYFLHNEEVYPLSFIHDEICFEVKDNENLHTNVKKCAELMIDSMQKTLPHVRITVEADIMPYWMKAGGEWSGTFFKNALNTGDNQCYQL